LTAWSSCSGPWRSAASDLALAPSSMPRLTELERLAGPSTSCFGTTQCGSEIHPRTLPRAELGVGTCSTQRARFDQADWRCSHDRNWRQVSDRSHPSGNQHARGTNATWRRRVRRSIPELPGPGFDLDVAATDQGLGLTNRDWPHGRDDDGAIHTNSVSGLAPELR
jgi:hypothetical protein